MSLNKVIVVIPVHKPALTQNELASLKQCYRILGSHPIRIVAPEGMDMSVYQNAVPGCESIIISPEWLSGIQQYNKLKISKYFYDLFKDYEYLLTYELDAWVFRDELLYWCNKGYDYIGAPWFDGYDYMAKKHILSVGNSGFSLRNIQVTLDLINRSDKILWLRKWWYALRIQGVFRFERLKIIERIFKIKFTDRFHQLIDGYGNHEDIHWARTVASTFPEYKIAPVSEAFRFSIEGNPSEVFMLNNYQIPFGCHAWEKYEPEFWKEFIHPDNDEEQPKKISDAGFFRC